MNFPEMNLKQPVLPLFRSDEVEKAWQKRLKELNQKFKESGLEGTLFDNVGWMEKQGVPVMRGIDPTVHVIKNDFKYFNTTAHYTLFQHKDFNPQHRGTCAAIHKAAARIIYNWHPDSMYVILRKTKGSIKYPHTHLLIYDD
jgi:hypothetical protein